MDKLIIGIADILDKIEETPLYKESEIESHVLYKFKREKPFTIVKESGVWIVRGDTIEKLFKMTKFNSNDATLRIIKKLKNMGIDDELKKLGAKQGDSIRIFNYEFEYVE